MTAKDRTTSENERTLALQQDDRHDRILISKSKLLVLGGPLQGREFIVDREHFSIGTGANNDLVLDDSTMSRRHCEIQQLQSGYLIRDSGSTNGTLVQGVRISEAYLDQGTEFQLGKTRIVFCPLHEAMEFKLSSQSHFGGLIGSSVAMRRVFYLAQVYSPTDATILIEGETGTGKELLAEAIHNNSRRRERPFHVIDCAALAKDIVESELFGHTKGSFTGANADRIGAFEQANGGTVFLDEIGELGLDLQPRLLRVLEKREIRRVGGNQMRPIDVRVICATNRKLENEVNAGTFREDLFFRLSVVRLTLAPLRHRKEDIEPLLRKFLREFLGRTYEKDTANIEKAVDLLSKHDWPGNVRELRNLVELASYSEQRPIDLSTFLYMGRLRSMQEQTTLQFSTDVPFATAKNRLVDEFERGYARHLMQKHGGNIVEAAKTAEMDRSTLKKLLNKHGLAQA